MSDITLSTCSGLRRMDFFIFSSVAHIMSPSCSLTYFLSLEIEML